MSLERNDPTHAGFTPPGTGTVRLSGNEVEMLCLKAARGAGLSWGLAEEAGFAARWLYERGIDGPAALASHLEGMARISSRIVLRDGALRGPKAGLLSPIAVGAAMSDLSGARRDTNRAGPVDRPLLVLPFLHQIAVASKGPVVLKFPGGSVEVSATGVGGDLSALEAARQAEIAIAPGAGLPAGAPARGFRGLAGHAATRLNDLAMLTYVPASAASRANAGSEDGDND